VNIRKVHDRDPALTLRRILLVINALGGAAPQKIVDWVVTTVEGNDGDIVKVRAFALKACTGARAADDETRILPAEAVAVIRDVCVRRLTLLDV
jgi:hypothetical protein